MWINFVSCFIVVYAHSLFNSWRCGLCVSNSKNTKCIGEKVAL